MINDDTKKKIAEAILKRQAFIDTVFDTELPKCDDDYEHLAYNALPMFGGIIIQEQYCGRIEYNTQYLYYDIATDTLVECSDIEDDYLHIADGERPFLECEPDFIIGKCSGNMIQRFDD